eukprot:CAMPEP_0196656218 /NCGR_PEP_ID=MMETSP1086-20130531/14046_1 /TAXON_ID=77921 /ORGANISM="Cyanoptyche  gloeocystis , Strain SAG4.97" /LENGTH=410 /DNA_ID=CAMNT_0041988867 /DNA_START=22 /DNA_END=1254 /DNA_ORIENTATION=+
MYDPESTPLITGRERPQWYRSPAWVASALMFVALVLCFAMLAASQAELGQLRNRVNVNGAGAASAVVSAGTSAASAVASNGKPAKPRRGTWTKERYEEMLPFIQEYVKGDEPAMKTWEKFKPTDIPKEFDWRNVNGKNYLTPNKQQHLPLYCGGCWAFSSIQTLNDRINIARNASGIAYGLAHQVLFNCQDCGDCEHGGYAYCVYGLAKKHGLPDETCQVYLAKTGTECIPEGQKGMEVCNPECICQNYEWDRKTHYAVTQYRRWYVKHYGLIPSGNVHAMKAEIFANGPIVCGMEVSDEFYWEYTSGIWTQDLETDPSKFDHMVSVSGWGVDENGTDYWLIRNTWGTYFGEDGWFKVSTNMDNNLGIGKWCVYATVDLERSVMPAPAPLGKYWDYRKYPVHPDPIQPGK